MTGNGNVPLQIVIDTSVMIASLRSKKGAAYKLMLLIDSGQFQMNLSVPLIAEYEDVSRRMSVHCHVQPEALCWCRPVWDQGCDTKAVSSKNRCNSMTTISVQVPDSLHKAVREIVLREGMSFDQFVVLAIAEKATAIATEDYLTERAKHGERAKFLAAMAKVADVEPVDESDRL